MCIDELEDWRKSQRPTSCLVCAQPKAKAIVHEPSGVFVCFDCRNACVGALPKTRKFLELLGGMNNLAPVHAEMLVDALDEINAARLQPEAGPCEPRPIDEIVCAAVDACKPATDGERFCLYSIIETACLKAIAAAAPAGEAGGTGTSPPVLFYGTEWYLFSNFSAFNLYWCGIRFHTSEAAYHWEKFRGQPTIQFAIQDALSAHEAFKIAEAYKTWRRSDWDAVKLEIMRDILRAKVDQHEYVKRKLLQTGDRELIEDSWRDSFWGWGEDHKGQNWLGKLWMQVRAELTRPSAAGSGKEGPQQESKVNESELCMAYLNPGHHCGNYKPCPIHKPAQVNEQTAPAERDGKRG